MDRMNIGLRTIMLGGWCGGWLIVGYLTLTPIALQFHGNDKLEHFLGYALVTLSAASFARDRREMYRWALIAVFLSTIFEVGQLMVPGRLFELADLAANMSGVTTGLVAGLLFISIRDRFFPGLLQRA